jgi:hypothetical protein
VPIEAGLGDQHLEGSVGHGSYRTRAEGCHTAATIGTAAATIYLSEPPTRLIGSPVTAEEDA